MKRTLLNDFMKIFNFLDCNGIKYTCVNCSNKAICDMIEKVINSIKKFY